MACHPSANHYPGIGDNHNGRGQQSRASCAVLLIFAWKDCIIISLPWSRLQEVNFDRCIKQSAHRI